MLDIFMIAIGCVVSAVCGMFVTLQCYIDVNTGEYFYLEEIDPDSPGEFSIRVSIPSNQYYLDKEQIILKRGKSQE